MLRRKAYEDIVRWKTEKTTQGLLVMGARQVGKTTIIRTFASKHYKNVAEINFYQITSLIDHHSAIHQIPVLAL